MLKDFSNPKYAPIGLIEDESGTMNPVFSEKSYDELKKGATDTLDSVNQVCPMAMR